MANMNNNEKRKLFMGILYVGRIGGGKYRCFGAPGKYGNPCTHGQALKNRSYIFDNLDKFEYDPDASPSYPIVETNI